MSETSAHHLFFARLLPATLLVFYVWIWFPPYLPITNLQFLWKSWLVCVRSGSHLSQSIRVSFRRPTTWLQWAWRERSHCGSSSSEALSLSLALFLEGIFYFQNHPGDPRVHFTNENDLLHNQQCSKAWQYTDKGGMGGAGKSDKTTYWVPMSRGRRWTDEGGKGGWRVRIVKREMRNCEAEALGA